MKKCGDTREQAKPIKTTDGRIIDPIYLGYANHRDYEKYLKAVEYAKGWNAAMDYVFGVNPNKPDIRLIKENHGNDDT